MDRSVSVIGEAEISASPDTVVLSLTLVTQGDDYSRTSENAADKANRLGNAVMTAGFDETELKTSELSVDTVYRNVRDESGNYQSVFDGYRYRQRLLLKFPTDMPRLALVLSEIGSCGVEPEVRISFTVEDVASVKSRLLTACAENAREKAETLCLVLGVKLGKVISIRCGADEPALMSGTDLSVENGVMPLMARASFGESVVPENIRVSESVSFVFEID